VAAIHFTQNLVRHTGSMSSGFGGEAIVCDRPLSFGFATVVHPEEPGTAWFIPGVKDEARYPVDGRLVVTRTRDGGQTFDVLAEGLPQRHSYDLVYRHGFDIDATRERLAFGSTTGNLWVSEDQGNSWSQVSSYLPPVYCVRFMN
jgi:hypothetical protein